MRQANWIKKAKLHACLSQIGYLRHGSVAIIMEFNEKYFTMWYTFIAKKGFPVCHSVTYWGEHPSSCYTHNPSLHLPCNSPTRPVLTQPSLTFLPSHWTSTFLLPTGLLALPCYPSPCAQAFGNVDVKIITCYKALLHANNIIWQMQVKSSTISNPKCLSKRSLQISANNPLSGVRWTLTRH